MQNAFWRMPRRRKHRILPTLVASWFKFNKIESLVMFLFFTRALKLALIYNELDEEYFYKVKKFYFEF